MCLVVLAWKLAGWDLVLGANRDEFHARPAAPAGFWYDAPHVLAGRDLEGGGTWLGVTDDGRFAALTNFRDPSERKPGAPSRGRLVAGYLTGEEAPDEYAARVAEESGRYAGFNILLGDADVLFAFASRTRELKELASGVYGLSNGVLDTPWPKVVRSKERLAKALEEEGAELVPETILALLDDRERAPDDDLPVTGVGLEWERALSAPRIVTPAYGTRCSTAVLYGDDEIVFVERTFDPDGDVTAENRFLL